MLEVLRQGASGWLAKILMGLLVVSFGIWGVRYSDLGGNAKTLVQIGGQNITTDQYQRLFSTELRRLEGQTHRRIDPATAHKAGLDQQVFSGLLVDAHARALNLGVSDQALLDRLAGQKNLQTADGRFDKTAFQFLLQSLGMSEAGYLEMLRRDTVREQLLASVTASAPPPAALIEAINQFQGEARTIDFFTVPISKAPAPAAADAARLAAFYEAHKDQYRAPEYRVFGVLRASPDDLTPTIAVADADVKATYEATKDSFGTPERRHVQLMSFADKASADKAFAALKSGKDFMTVAKEMGLADKDVDRGLIVKGDLLDKVAGEAAFKLAKDKVSDPIDGALATSLIRVTEIQPGIVKTFADVKGEIRDRLAHDKALRQLVDERGKIEDARAGGTALKDMPGKFPFKYTQLPPLDAKGVGIDGKAATGAMPDLEALLKAAFQSDVGVEAEPIDLGKDGWAWVEVKEVKASRQKTMDEVKAELAKALADDGAASSVGKMAADFADRANKGEDFAKLAKEAGDSVKSALGVKRGAPGADLPPGAVQLAFALARGAAASIGAADGTSRLVFKVSDIKPAGPLDDTHKTDVVAALAQQAGGMLESQYVAGLEQAYGFRLDEAQFKQLTGAGQADQGDQ